jgi:hypothetical protein
MEDCQVWIGPEVETVEAVNYFGMDMGKLAVRGPGALPSRSNPIINARRR